jgi:hypothetical protein
MTSDAIKSNVDIVAVDSERPVGIIHNCNKAPVHVQRLAKGLDSKILDTPAVVGCAPGQLDLVDQRLVFGVRFRLKLRNFDCRNIERNPFQVFCGAVFSCVASSSRNQIMNSPRSLLRGEFIKASDY